MALLIKWLNDKELHIKGTDIVIPQVYVRLTVLLPASPKGITCNLEVYQDKESYIIGKGPIEIEEIAFSTDSQPIVSKDQLMQGHQIVKDLYESMGYEVEILYNVE